ncbi:unnamed protein product [Chrysodeixis includens]|uniref:Kazal-like domain-containing protein n=1 Tax=Chrysodeixis includens TaxID=689277 RepID=A0A9N8KS68_CHRIL|nr:unnamed protein product [Chrysodeixis includens]
MNQHRGAAIVIQRTFVATITTYLMASRAVKAGETHLQFIRNPAPDGHRCGICPMYFQKICAFDLTSNNTYIFDNHCVMDLYNCIEGAAFVQMKYERCLYFGNFGYVHGYKYEDMDYGEDRIVVKHTQKNPDFIR